MTPITRILHFGDNFAASFMPESCIMNSCTSFPFLLRLLSLIICPLLTGPLRAEDEIEKAFRDALYAEEVKGDTEAALTRKARPMLVRCCGESPVLRRYGKPHTPLRQGRGALRWLAMGGAASFAKRWCCGRPVAWLRDDSSAMPSDCAAQAPARRGAAVHAGEASFVGSEIEPPYTLPVGQVV